MVRTGIDTVSVAAVREALDAHGERYLRRVYTPAERADCRGPDGVPAPERLAARWAAKEAAVKALRAGAGGFGWTDAELVTAPGGHPELRLHGPLAELARRDGLVGEPAVSVTHEAGLASAVVILTTGP